MGSQGNDGSGEFTADWPVDPPTPPQPADDDDGGATAVVPRTPPLAPPPPPPPLPAPLPPQPPPHLWNGAPPPYAGPHMPPTPPTYWGPPGGPPPNSVSVSPVPRKSSGRRWALIGAAVVAVIAIVAATVLVLRSDSDGQAATPATTSAAPASPSTTTTTTTGPQVVDPAAASTLLAAVDEANGIADNVPLTPGPVSRKLVDNTYIDPTFCSGAVAPGVRNVYSGSGFTGFAAQSFTAESPNYRIIQAVSVFESPAAARKLVDQQVRSWGDCTNRDITLTVTGSGDPETARIGALTIEDGIARLPIAPTPDRTCDRALAAKNNVVIDVRFCSSVDSGGGVRLVRAIADKIPAAG